MTDEFDPEREASTLESDPTARVEMPTTPTAPLTPATRDHTIPTTYEHEVAWGAAAPSSLVLAPRPSRPRRRMRWAISIVVVAIVIATSAAVAVIIAGKASTATVLGYVPDHSIAYLEVRLDLPGDQRRAVGEFLSKFPGFADQAALDTKLDETLDDLVKKATQDAQTYTTDIKPWFDGEIAASVGPLPPASAVVGGDPAVAGSFRGLVLISIKDPAIAQAWFDAEFTKSGAKTTTQAYDGATLTVFEKTGGVQAAFALVDGKVAVAGDLESVKAAVDTKGSGAFAAEPGPKAALASLNDDHVGFTYLALRPLLDWSTELSKAMAPGGGPATTALSASMLKVIPDWGAYSLRFQSDALVLEATAPVPETRLGPTSNRTSTMAEHIPSTAIMAAVADDAGTTVKQALDLYRAEPSFKPAMDQIDKALGLVGGPDAALGWAGDTAVVVNISAGTPEGGLIVGPTDRAAAERLFTSLRTFISLGGGQQGITVRDETYSGTTITIVDLGDLGKLAGLAGMAGMAGTSGLPAMTGHLELAFAVTDQIVVVGSGPDFVKHVLDTTKDTSLASNDRYKKLADRAGNGTGSTFVDITAIRGLVEKAAVGSGVDPAALAKYEKDVKPFLVPFDAMYASSSAGGDLNRSSIYITVK